MIRFDRSFVALVLLALAWPAAAQSQADRFERVMVESGMSGSVIVAKGGATVWSAGYGMANIELGIPNTPTTKFRIGSLTKQFTAMAILILQDRGLIDVSDPVGDHVEELPESWRGLTIHQLLTHTSGIMHSWALPGFWETMAAPATLDETLARFYDQPLLFEPGTDFRYSGVGYFLLAKTIEVVSGETYSEFLKQEIFEPLGMNDSGAEDPRDSLQNRASGYQRADDGTTTNAPDIFVPILTGGGNLYSTVEDMARWDQALADSALVSERAYAAMYHPERRNYAYGWLVQERGGQLELGHAGGISGFLAYNMRIPEEEIDVVLLTNVTPGTVRRVARALAEVLLSDLDPPGGAF